MEREQLSFDFIKQLKQQILASRYVVAKIANAESIRLYFSIGRLVEKEFQRNKWGAKVNDEIASRLQQELPGLRGFSGKNIAKMRTFFKAWKNEDLIYSSLTSKLETDKKTNYSSATSKMGDEENKGDIIGTSATTHSFIRRWSQAQKHFSFSG